MSELLRFFWMLTGLLLIGGYLRFMLNVVRGLRKAESENNKLLTEAAHAGPVQKGITVLVAIHNESACIPDLLESLIGLSYPAQFTQIMLVDDHSTDDTASKIRQFIKRFPDRDIVLLDAQEMGQKRGKKAALALGVSLARYEWIACTDADCRPGREWLTALAAYMNSDPGLLLGPLIMDAPGRSDLPGAFQVFESLALLGVMAGSAGAGKAVLASGANLAFHRLLFFESLAIRDDMHLRSGDDMFLLEACKTIDKRMIHFVYSPGAIIRSLAVSKPGVLLRQRCRWAAKSLYFKDRDIRLAGLLTAGSNLFLAAGMLVFPLLFGMVTGVGLLLLFWSIKTVSDIGTVGKAARMARQSLNLLQFLLFSLLYPFYVCLTLIASLGFRNQTDW